MKSIVSLLAVAGLAGIASAQAFPANTNMVFEVWNGSSWSSSVNAVPGTTVSFRVRMEYTGSGAVALDSVRYQPYFSNSDNSGPNMDMLAPITRSGGPAFANGDLAAVRPSEQPASLNAGPTTGATNRVSFGSTAMQTSAANVLTFFRHGDGAAQNGAPAGSFLRIAGSGVGFNGTDGSGDNAQWPAASIGSGQGALIARVLRGVAASQSAAVVAGNPNANFVAGTNVVIFAGDFIVSSDAGQDRTVTLSADESSLAREGGSTSADDRRRVVWKATTDEITGSIKSGVNFVPATIVIPTPASIALLGLGGLVATRRRRA